MVITKREKSLVLEPLVYQLKVWSNHFIISRSGNTYTANLNNIPSNVVYLLSNKDKLWLCHRRISHIHVDHLNKLTGKNLVIGFPNLHFEKSQLCDVCQKGKQVGAFFKVKNNVSTNRHLQLLHTDLFASFKTKSFGPNLYALVVVDDYSRYTWTLFLSQKRYMFATFLKLVKCIHDKKWLIISSIWSDHGEEFHIEKLYKFRNENSIRHTISTPQTTL